MRLDGGDVGVLSEEACALPECNRVAQYLANLTDRCSEEPEQREVDRHGELVDLLDGCECGHRIERGMHWSSNEVHHRQHRAIRMAVDDGAHRRFEGDAGHEHDWPCDEPLRGSLAECSGLSLKRDDGAHT